ncbi:BapA/Bap/LapF family large adhesin [Tenebrionicola larvae]|uniref:VCBS domain-containing protein n=2 Tax=Tenebrionibacter/Tenebrionicola group TaxID=2969848 RepID=A0A949Q536_9ENTR|nr:BapA/Bap/LapF family large adhesin [Tenebrionicola larvae]MBV5095308.1 VCBS domain-containing protein [Tenebrionicola larvae]
MLGSVTAGSDGKWSFTPSSPLKDGEHNLTTTVTDAAGNTSERSPVFTLTVDTVAPGASAIAASDNTSPQTGPLTSGSSTNDATPTLNGKAEAGSVVTIYDGNTLLGSVVAGSDGKWTFTPSTALSEGEHSLSTTVTDAAGNVSERSDFFAVKVDTSAPDASAPVATDNTAPQTGALPNGAATNDTTPTLNGSAEAGSKVIIYDGNAILGSVVAGSDGTWRFTPSSPLSQGSHSLTITVTDAAGNVSERSPALAITVDTQAPGVPTLQTLADNVGTIQGNLSRGDTTDDTTPTLSGSAEAGSKVMIYDGSTLLGSVTAGSDGKWTFTPPALGQGSHNFTITATDAAGNVSARSPAFLITIDTDAPANAQAPTATDNVMPVTGAINNGDTTNDTTPTFAGTGESGDTVTIYDGDNAIGSTIVDENGAWSFTPAEPLDEGEHTITTTVTDAAGNESDRSPSLSFTIDNGAPGEPNPPTDAPTATDDAEPVTGVINSGDSTNDATPTFAGSGQAGEIVTIYDGDNAIGSTTVDENGAWSFTPADPLGEGSHTITTTVTDAAGNESAKSPSLDFTVDTEAPDAPASAPTATDDEQPVTGAISSGDSTNDTTPTFAGSGQAGEIVTIYDGDNAIGSTTVDENGAWSFTPADPLGEGSHTITTTVTDAAGNESAKSPSLDFTVDTEAPDAPASAPSATDDEQPVTGAINSGDITNDTTPTFAGSGQAGEIVTIYDGDNAIGSTTVDENGAWSFTPADPLGEGSHTITTTVTDAAGNESAKSPSLDFTVDTEAPDAPASAPSATDDEQPVTGIINSGDSTNDTTPTFAGSGQAGEIVTIYDGDNAIGSTTVDENGAWSFTPADPLGEGSHTITTTVTDAAGNESDRSPSLSFTIDNGAPGEPNPPTDAPTATDDAEPVTGVINSGDSTNDATPTFAGSGQAGEIVTIYDGDNAIGSVTVDENGAWSFTPADPLGEGSHAITTTVTDAAGNESAKSPSLDFTVDTEAPDAPASAPTATDDEQPVTGAISSGDITNDATPTFAGSGQAGEIVTIYDGDNAIGSVTVDENGAWSFTPADPLGEGEHAITTTVTDAAGNESAKSPSLDFTVDTEAPDAPASAPSATDDEQPVTGIINSGDSTNDTTPTFAGSGQAGEIITIYDGDNAIGSVTVDENGAWSFTPADPLGEGSHAITTTVTDAAGNESAKSPSLDFTIDTEAPDAPASAPSATDDEQPVTGAISSGDITNDATPTFAGSGQAGEIVTIYDGDNAIGSVTVDENGAWSFTPADPLGEGEHAITTTVTDAAGNESAKSPSLDFTVDTEAPDAPASAPSATDDVGLEMGPIPEGATTDDNKPTFSGVLADNTGEIITIYDGDTAIGSTTVGADGAWSFTPATALEDGEHSFTTTLKDALGNESAHSPSLGFTIDAVTAGDIQANDDDIQLDVTTTTATVNTNESDTGIVLVGLLGDLLNLGTENAVAGFNVGAGHSADINVTVTGEALLGLVNDLNVAVQRWDTATNSWVTVADTTSDPSLIQIISNTSVEISLDDLPAGEYRVAAYSNNALAGLLSTTTVSVDIADTGPAISGAASGNVITGSGDAEGADVITEGTVVSQVTGANGIVYNVPAGDEGLTLQGEYGTLNIHADGSYTYTLTNVSSAASGKVDSFTYTLNNGVTTSSADLNITLGTANGASEGDTLLAHDNDIEMLETPVVTTDTYTDSGFLLIGSLGNILSLLGTANAVASFSVATDHSASIDVSVTGSSLLGALTDVDLLVQRYNSATASWETVADTSSNPTLINIIGNSRVTVHLDDLAAGQYRVVGYSDNTLLGLASTTTVSVNVTDTGPATLHGSLKGNVVTDSDVLHGVDSITAGTLVSQVTDSAGVVHTVGAQGVTVNGLYGTLTIAQDGSYTYTLTAPSGIANGHSEEFTYTLSDGTNTSSASLNIDLGAPGSNNEVVAAFNDTATLDIDTQPLAVNHDDSSHGGITLGISLGGALDLNLINLSEQATLSVGADEMRSLTLTASMIGVSIGTSYDLYVYRYSETTGQYELSQRTANWFVTTLIGVSDPLPITLGEGNYVFLLSPSSGISVGNIYNLAYTDDTTHSVVTAAGSTSGNVISEGAGADTVPAGSAISSVDGNAIAATGNTVIMGQYGTLTINAQGAYTYTLHAGLSPTTVGDTERFTYTVRGPEGASSSATLTINLQHQAVTAVEDISTSVEFAATEPTQAYTATNLTSQSWTTTASASGHTANGNIHVDEGDVLTSLSLKYTMTDSVLLGSVGMTLNYNITNAAGVIISQGTAIATNTDASVAAINLGSLALTAGDYVLHVTGTSAGTSADILGNRPEVSVSATLSGTTISVDTFLASNTPPTITGNLYDGSDSGGERDNLGSVNTTLTITGASANATLHQYDLSPASIAGHYGTLTIKPDGSYSYALKGNLNTNSITEKEVFDYTLTGPNGTSASASLTIDLHPILTGGAQANVATSTAYDDTYTLGGASDTVIFHLLDNQDATGGNGTQNVWTDFSTAQQDRINLDELLTGWDGNSASLGQYLNITHSGGDTVVSIDRDGSGSAFQSTQLVTLDNVSVTLEELLQHQAQETVS